MKIDAREPIGIVERHDLLIYLFRVLDQSLLLKGDQVSVEFETGTYLTSDSLGWKKEERTNGTQTITIKIGGGAVDGRR